MIEYIASGTSYLRMHADRQTAPENFDSFVRALNYVRGANNHKFGLLFNAYTESGFGAAFQKFRPYVDSIHADSGGLQIVTQGLKIDGPLKTKIYKTQAQWADIGMCFDEIPIGTHSGRSGRNDVNNRWFKKDELEHYARQTGKNLREQIDSFLEEKTTCRPMLIAQGNCYDSYMRWVEYVVDEVGQDREKYIGGVAMGAAALGTGLREDIFRAFMFKQLPVDLSHNHLHILGVGSVKRLLPYVTFMKNGYYEGTHISYDSTTHTSGVELGLFYDKNSKGISFNRIYSPTYELVFEEIKDIFPELSDYTPRDFHEVMNNGFTKYTGKESGEIGKSEFLFTKMRTAFSFKSIYNFTNHLNNVILNNNDYDLECQKAKSFMIMKNLLTVKDLDSWKNWEAHCGRHVKSAKVSSAEPTSIDDFI